MSDSIASLGLIVDSSQVKTATSALQSFSQAATPAASAAATFSNASQGVSTAVDEGTVSLRGQREAIRGLALDATVLGGSFSQLISTAGLLYVENARLMENYGGFANAVSKILTPTNLLIGGFIGIAAGAALAYESVIKTAQAYSQLSDQTNTAVQALRGLDTSAAGKGISDTDFNSAIEKFNQNVLEANIGTGTLAGLLRANGAAAGTMVDDLAHVADLVANAKTSAQQYQILQEAGLPTTQAWVRYLSQGGDAIRAASASGNSFSAAEQTMVDKAKDLDDKFDAIWKSIKNEGTSAVVTIAGKLDDLSNSKFFKIWHGLFSASQSLSLGGKGGGPAVPVYDDQSLNNMSPQATGSGFAAAGTKTQTKESALADLSKSSTYISLLGQQASVTDIVTQKQNELDRSFIETGITLNGSARAAVLAYTQAQALGTLQIQSETDAENMRAQAVGMGIGATAAFTAKQNLLNEAQRNHKTLTADDIAQINSYAEALGVATQAAASLKLQSDTSFTTSQLGRTDIDQNVATQLRSLYGDDYLSHMNDAIAGQIRFNDAMKETKDIAGSALSTFLQDIAAGKTGTQAFTDALTQLENKMFDIISNQAMSALFKAGQNVVTSYLGGGAGGAQPLDSSGLAAIHHKGYAPGDPIVYRDVDANTFNNAPRFHSGVGPGERAAVITNEESVLTPAQMKALAPAGRQSQGGGTVVNITNNSGAQISQTKRSDNGVDIVDVMVGQVGKAMANGDLNSALAARPGGRQPIAKR